MPANNRVHSSAALQTHGIWQSAIGYDPYAPNKDDSKNSSSQMTAAAEPDGENAYASFQGLLALARITGSNADEARGACKKCGRVGHLTFQCKNFVSLKESKEKDPEAIQAAVLNGLDKLKGGKLNGKKEMESEEEEDDSFNSLERSSPLGTSYSLLSSTRFFLDHGDIGCGGWEFADHIRGGYSGDKGVRFSVWEELRWLVCVDGVDYGGGSDLGRGFDVGRQS